MWLLEARIKQIIENAENAGIIPTAEQQINFDARQDDENSTIIHKAGNTAEISIKGVMTKSPSFLSMLFGGGNTTYSSIVSAIKNAENDDDIKTIVLDIDSPGGQFDGMFSAIDAIAQAKKPVTAVVTGSATSAAFGLASQADEIVAINRAAMVGSVGVVATIKVLDDEVTITSTNAPQKAPDVKTKEGVKVIQDRLDDMHAIFVEAIAQGRNTTVKDVNANFGKGSVLLAGEALKRGMIDTISGPTLKLVDSANDISNIKSVNKQEVVNMDLKEFKLQHNDIYCEAVDVGAKQELDRVKAHLIMGQQSGDLKTAIAAISDGSDMSCELQAKYMAAGMNKSDVSARALDDEPTNKATDNIIDDGKNEDDKQSDLVADLVISKFSKGK